MGNTIEELTKLGQSLWYDNIQRRLLENGELEAMITCGDIRGVTSNPSIFNHAIAKSQDYDSALAPLALSGWDAEQIFWQLAKEDIRAACDLFLPLYRQTQGADGYVSIEVSPTLAHDTQGTIAQAQELWDALDRPNLMVKIPATKAGIPAIRRSIAAGINVNVTLIFSIKRYLEVMDAYLGGLEDRLAAGAEVAQVHSVASFFVSRVDTKVDGHLDEILHKESAQAALAQSLHGKAAIANAKLAYEEFRRVFGQARFAQLKQNQANVQRPLWASTSTKNPAYPDTLYVDSLIGSDTVNTVPPQTLVAFKDHGTAKVALLTGVDDSKHEIEGLESLGISIDQVTQELEDEGVKAFADAFAALLETIDQRRKTIVGPAGPLAASVSQRVTKLESEHAAARLHDVDPTLWTADPDGQAEIKIRMGWLTLPETSRAALPEIKAFAEEVKAAGLDHFLLLGMGGSSLAPEVLSLVFAEAPGAKNFAILDSTDPAQVLETAARFPLDKTLFIVSSKSGGTAEPNAMLDFFWDAVQKKVGGKAGSQFVAVTDPNTSLEKLGKQRDFCKVFRADPLIGGRYSALTHFGLVPAALMGIDVDRLLDRAAWMAAQCAKDVPAARNPGLVLGAVLGQAALQGRDKLTIVSDSALASVGSWLEQLIAESSGKLGKGIVPVDLEPLAAPASYGQDRVFVYLRQDGAFDAALAELQAAGQPLFVFNVSEAIDLGAEFYRWEVATAIACAVLGVNAFDQPNVQDSKGRTEAKVAAYQQSGQLDEGAPTFEKDGLRAFASVGITGNSLQEVLNAFLSKAGTGEYVAVNAYLPRNPAMSQALTDLRTAIRARTKCATTVGFGPRFQHSTGQLHKGGANNGLFLQLTADAVQDVEIPTQGLTFGVMERAQALGDLEALAVRERRYLRLNLPAPDAIQRVLDALK